MFRSFEIHHAHVEIYLLFAREHCVILGELLPIQVNTGPEWVVLGPRPIFFFVFRGRNAYSLFFIFIEYAV